MGGRKRGGSGSESKGGKRGGGGRGGGRRIDEGLEVGSQANLLREVLSHEEAILLRS